MIDEYNTTRILDDIFFSTKMKIDSDNLRYFYDASGRYSERFHISLCEKLHMCYFICRSHTKAYRAFFQLPIRNSIKGIHNPADSALAIMKKINFARYRMLSFKAQSITRRNIKMTPLVVHMPHTILKSYRINYINHSFNFILYLKIKIK